jgi:hypothetical protein
MSKCSWRKGKINLTTNSAFVMFKSKMNQINLIQSNNWFSFYFTRFEKEVYLSILKKK